MDKYKFYYGCVSSSPPSRQLWFDPSPGMTAPGYVHQRIDGSKEVWICDGCIRRKRIRKRIWSLMLAIVVAPPIYFAVWAILYYCVKPIDSALKKMPCCALPLVILGGLILLMFLILPFGIVLEAFKSKEEIGDSIAIEIRKKAIEESVNWINPDAKIIDGFLLEPRRVLGFWTRKQKETEKFSRIST